MFVTTTGTDGTHRGLSLLAHKGIGCAIWGRVSLQLLQLHKYLIFKKQKLKKNSPRRRCNLLRANKGCKCQEQGVGPKVVSISLRRGVQLLHITHSKCDGSFLWSLIPSVWKILGLFWWAQNR